MKKLLIILAGLIPSLFATAQCMYIYQGNIATMVNAATAGDMTYTTSALTVRGITFPLTSIDSIVVKEAPVTTDSVLINYSGTSAEIFMPIEVASYLNVTATDAHVSIVSSQLDGDEIKYALSGTATEGSFYQQGDYKCTLYLNGVNLTSSKGAAINIDNGKRIDVYVTDGTTNNLADCTNGTQTACFRIKGHAEFRGAGELNLVGNTNHAYKSNEYTILKKNFNGTINITSAVSDGIHVSQYFEMNGGTINISGAGSDGIQADITDDPTEEYNGQMFLNGGTANITLTGDNASGLKIDSLFTCTGGTYTIVMSGRNSDGVSTLNSDISESSATTTFTITQNGGYLTDTTGDKKKSACFKSDNDMYFHAGTIMVYANGDKANGIKVGNNYYYSNQRKTNVTPDVDGSMIIIAN